MVILNQTQTTREDQSSYGNSNIYLKNVKGAPSNEPVSDKGSFKEFEVLEKVMCLPETKIPRFFRLFIQCRFEQYGVKTNEKC